LTRLRYEFEPLRAQLLARYPYVSLMDALAKVHNEENLLQDAARGESGGFHCGWDGHVEAFCYRKKKAQKAQACHSSRVLVPLVLEFLRVLIVQRHRSYSSCFIIL
jgi:hypothetical protein